MVPPAVTRVLVENERAAIEAWAERWQWTVAIDADALRVEARTRHPQDGLPLVLVGDISGFPAVPPAWSFVNPYTGEASAEAFPAAGGSSIFHSNVVICAPWNRLAFAVSGGPHGDWGEFTSWQDERPSHTRATTLADMLSQVGLHLQQSPGRMAPVYRLRPLPVMPARGHMVVAATVLAATSTILTSFRGEDGDHEGMAFWLGRVVGADTYVLSAIRPDTEHGRGHVMASAEAVGDVSRRARSADLGIVAQVHSHPGAVTRHSDGDDELVLMPFDGMFSLVVADYGRAGFGAGSGLGMHQFQDGRWVEIEAADNALITVPADMMA